MIYTSYTEFNFADDLRDSFSYEASRVIFEYLDDADYDIEFDEASICGQFTEYDSLAELCEDYEAELSNYLPDRDEAEDDRAYEYDDIEKALDSVGAWYRVLKNGSVVIDVESF